MQAAPWASFSSFAAITPSNSTLVNCRAIFVGGAGNVIVAAANGGTQVTFAALAGAVLPIELNQGKIGRAHV